MKTVYIPKGETVHYESLATEHLVVHGRLHVTYGVKAQSITGSGVIDAGSINADTVCIDDVESGTVICKRLIAKRVQAPEVFASESAAVSCFLSAAYYPTDPDNIALLLRGIRFPEGVTTNLLDPCCGCGKALRQLAQGNNCYAYGVELDESRAEEAQTRLHRVGFGSFFHSSISREAFHLLFLNPPYLSVINESGGRSRHEKRFLIESLPALAYGGLVVHSLIGGIPCVF